MTESATADSTYYSHTLTHRPPHLANIYHSDPSLSLITSRLPSLPSEIRNLIYHHAFSDTRVAVTVPSAPNSAGACYCATSTKGPYGDECRWLFSLSKLPLRSQLWQEVQRAFVREALWEVHCSLAFDAFVSQLTTLGGGGKALLHSVRHLKANVFELDAHPTLTRTQLAVFGKGLASVTFGPWQKGWTVDLPFVEGEEGLSDGKVMERVRHVVGTKVGYEGVRGLVEMGRKGRGGWRCGFLFAVRHQYAVGGMEAVVGRRWLLKVWRADLDEGTIDRTWRDVHLVQEATLD